MIPVGDIALQSVNILSLPCPSPHPEIQECEFPTTEVGARNQSELGSHQLLASLSPPAVVFPQDLLEKGLEADNFAMLGLGDIVIPGDRAGVGEGFPRSRSTVKQTALPCGKEKVMPHSHPRVSPGFGERVHLSKYYRMPVVCQTLTAVRKGVLTELLVWVNRHYSRITKINVYNRLKFTL